jgi:hypothetical protein
MGGHRHGARRIAVLPSHGGKEPHSSNREAPNKALLRDAGHSRERHTPFEACSSGRSPVP